MTGCPGLSDNPRTETAYSAAAKLAPNVLISSRFSTQDGRMRRTLNIAALALMLSAAANAQQITRRESRGEVRNRVNVNSVVAAMDNTSRITTRVHGLGDLTVNRVRIVDVRPYIPAAQRPTYLAALDRNSRKIELLRGELVTIDPVVLKLADQRPALDVDDVVAAGILDVIETGESENILVLYVDNRNRLPSARPRTDGRTLDSFRPSTSSLVSAVNATPETVARISALEGLRSDRVRFYDIDQILSTAEFEMYRSAVRQNETSIRALRAELSKWPVVVQAMSRHQRPLVLGNIFGADVIGSGDVLVLYYRSRQ